MELYSKIVNTGITMKINWAIYTKRIECFELNTKENF